MPELRALSAAEIAADAINLYVENLEQHGHDPERARAEAIIGATEGAEVVDADLAAPADRKGEAK